MVYKDDAASCKEDLLVSDMVNEYKYKKAWDCIRNPMLFLSGQMFFIIYDIEFVVEIIYNNSVCVKMYGISRIILVTPFLHIKFELL